MSERAIGSDGFTSRAGGAKGPNSTADSSVLKMPNNHSASSKTINKGNQA